jgi:hypothetical protein
MQKTLQFLMQLMVHVTRQKQQIWFYLENPLMVGMHGAPLQGNFPSWVIVVVWCNILPPRTPDGNDDRGRMSEQCLDVILWQS